MRSNQMLLPQWREDLPVRPSNASGTSHEHQPAPQSVPGIQYSQYGLQRDPME